MSFKGAPTAGSCRGKRIGKYELLVHVATGGMGAVYRARDTETGGEIALKVLTPESAAKAALVVRFEREARNASMLRHENIVAVLDSGFDKATGTHFMAMEFVEGKDLHDYIEAQGQLEPEEARQILIQAARALVHADVHGIVHRDIKPSNFLLTRKNGRLVVKLTDLGLSREVDNEEFRVTRSGTTVGTVDYISPEQARDSGAADIRSDLYSLGCTGFHMLAGRPPFAEGGLAERLVKHMTQEPPNLRKLNPRISTDLAAVLAKLLAKKPSQRHQTPTDLLKELLETPALARTTVQRDTVPDVPVARVPSKGKKRRTRSGSKRNANQFFSRERLPLILGIAGGVLGLVILGCVVYFLTRGSKNPPTSPTSPASPETVEAGEPNPGRPVGPGTSPTTVRNPDKPPPNITPPVEKPPLWAPLTVGAQPLAANEAELLRARLQGSVAGLDDLPANPLTLRVARVPAMGSDKSFSTLAAAVAAVPEGGSAVIEIHDNGPFFDPGFRTTRRKLVIRAGKDDAGKEYHPLLVWDVARAIDERKKIPLVPGETRPLAFLEVEQGLLALHGCEIAVIWPEAALTWSKRTWITHVLDGDLALRGCTVSALRGPEEGLVVAGLQSQEKRRCLLERCYVRGEFLSALDVRAPAADVLVDRCLLVGGDQPLVLVQAASLPEQAITLRALRSTLVAGRNLFRLEAAENGGSPGFAWVGWDVLLTHTGKDAGGEMLTLAAGINPATIKWEATNCLYAGWDRLVAGAKTVGSGDEATWRKFWKDSVLTDRILLRSWPLALPRPERQPMTAYRIDQAQPVAFAATGAVDQPLGCDLAALSARRDTWPALLEPFVLPSDDVDAPQLGQGSYPGATIDLTRSPVPNLASLLQKVTLEPGSRVVFRLTGVPSGPVPLGPLKLPRGTSLVISCDPPAKADGPLVVLQFARPLGEKTPDAWIEMEGGNLHIVNAELRMPHPPPGILVPACLIKVRGGNLNLTRCKLTEPPDVANGTSTLIALEGSGEADVDKAYVCCLTESVVAGGQDAIHLIGVGARLAARSSLLVSGGDVVNADPRPGFHGAANMQVQFSDCTVAARRAVVHVCDLPTDVNFIDPILVQSRKSAYLGAYQRTDKPCLLTADEQALAHGVVMWQGEADALDSRLSAGVCLLPGSTAPVADWSRLWGPRGLAHPLTPLTMPDQRLEGDKPLEGKPWPLERLQLPVAMRKLAGANLVGLKVVKGP